jgi:hypothetical protein
MRRERNSAEWHQHMAAIKVIVDAWLDGELSLTAKRDAIAAENRFYHGRERRSPATGEQLCTVSAETPPAAVAVAEREPVQEALFEDDEREEWWKR